jgi:hypothetical protein
MASFLGSTGEVSSMPSSCRKQAAAANSKDTVALQQMDDTCVHTSQPGRACQKTVIATQVRNMCGICG